MDQKEVGKMRRWWIVVLVMAVCLALVAGCGTNLTQKRTYEGERAARAVAEEKAIAPVVGRDIKAEGPVTIVTEKAVRAKRVDATTEEAETAFLKRVNPWSLILYGLGVLLFIGIAYLGYRWIKAKGWLTGADSIIKLIRHKLESAEGLLKSELSSLVNDAESERATKGK